MIQSPLKNISNTSILLFFLTITFITSTRTSKYGIPPELSIKHILEARERLQGIVYTTPLQYMSKLSSKYQANIYVKREDLQVVRSYKIRGAYNKMSTLSKKETKFGGVCASAGNHAQGVAFACKSRGVFCTIFMPISTSQQKIKKVKKFGRKFVKIVITGATFDDAYTSSLEF